MQLSVAMPPCLLRPRSRSIDEVVDYKVKGTEVMLLRLRKLPVLMAAAMLPVVASARLGWGSRDILYRENVKQEVPQVKDTTVCAWRGERVGALALVRASGAGVVTANISGPLKGKAHFTDYVLTDDFRACGRHPDNLEAYKVADIIDTTTNNARLEDGEVRPVWVTIEVPRDVPPGVYRDTLAVDGDSVMLNINVQPHTLPAPESRSFFLNLWQQPYAVSRYGGVEPWSPAHFELLKPYARMLARAGQRTVSTILFFEPWGEQSNDLFLPMVGTTLRTDGSWAYDYTVFDRWVEFMYDNGVGPYIECFSMIPWDMSFRYYDEASGEYKALKTTTGSQEYRALWESFLSAFVTHLRDKGWFDNTMIAMDERSAADMANAISIIDSVAPDMKVSLAGNYHGWLEPRLDMLTLTAGDTFPPGILDGRHKRGDYSLLYTCCSSPEPNLFSNSMPSDAVWLPVYAVATGHDGYLHWSWINWTDNPMEDSRFKLFAPGDTYFIYPDGRSSVRFERLVEGIELSEKVRMLRQQFVDEGNIAALEELNRALRPIVMGIVNSNSTTAQQVNYLKQVVDRLGDE